MPFLKTGLGEFFTRPDEIYVMVYSPFHLSGVPTGSCILYEHWHPDGSLIGHHKCLGYKMCMGPQRHPWAVTAIVFKAIHSLESNADPTTFPAKTEPIKVDP